MAAITTMASSSTCLLSPLTSLLGSEELVDAMTNQSSILLVGAGGIGCEVLKNLALSGFANVTVIDLDTIDVSNLNRQLLFRSQHVGQPKCTTAAQVASEMLAQTKRRMGSSNHSDNNINDHTTTTTTATTTPPTKPYKAIFGNVCDTSLFHVQFVKEFDLVINALDNLTARRRVNRLCLAASVPLIEAGTTGYLGQVNVIAQPKTQGGGGSNDNHDEAPLSTACYECQTVETPKVYPICTIRSTPSRPVHTIVWAKEFYKLLYGPKVEESMLFDDVSTLQGEVSTYMDTVRLIRRYLHTNNNPQEQQQEQQQSEATETTTTTEQEALPATTATDTTSPSSFTALIRTLIQNLYCDEIQKQLDLERYKTALQTPVPLRADEITLVENSETAAVVQAPAHDDVAYWSSRAHCCAQLAQVIRTSCSNSNNNINNAFPESFDKDHDGAMWFVTAASNLRNLIFKIEPLQSIYSAKGIAGNIIPAIATTNAIAAGLQMLQVYRVLEVAFLAKQKKESTRAPSVAERCCYNNIVRNPTRNGLVITAVPLERPNPNCFVCRQGMVEFTCNTHVWTLQHLVERILQQELGLQEPSITVGNNNALIWEQGEDSDQALFQVNWTKPLSQLPAGGIQNGTIVRVDDFTQALEVSIHVSHQDHFGDDNVTGGGGDAKKADAAAEGGTTTEEFPFLLKGAATKGGGAASAPSNNNNNDKAGEGHSSTTATVTAAAAVAAKDGKDNADDDDGDVVVVVKREKRALKKPDGEQPDSKRPRRDPSAAAASSLSADAAGAASSFLVDVVVIDDD